MHILTGSSPVSSVVRLITVVSVLSVVVLGCSTSSTKKTTSTVHVAATTGATTATTTAPPTTATASSQSSTTAPASGTLSGTWSGQYSGASQGTFTLNWRQSGSHLTGTIKISSPSDTLPINGTVQGGAIRFGTLGQFGVTYTGSVSGNAMSGTYEAPTGPGNWSATKSS